MTSIDTSPDVAVVIPCYNGASYVQAAAASVLAQQDVALEVVIVDDGSTDESADLADGLARDDQRVRVLRQRNGGVAAARNAGLAEVSDSVEYMMFLDVDDVVRPGALRRLVDTLIGRPDAVAAAGTCERIDAAGHLTEVAPSRFEAFEVRGKTIAEVNPTLRLTFRNFLPSNAITTPGQCVVRRASLGIRPFEGTYTPCEDWDLWLRLTSDRPIVPVDDVVLQYRDHAEGLSKRYDTMRDRRVAVLAAHRAVAVDDDVRALIDRSYWFVRFQYDRRLNLRWAGAALRRGQVPDAARFAARAGGLVGRSLVERVRDHRVPWWERHRAETNP